MCFVLEQVGVQHLPEDRGHPPPTKTAALHAFQTLRNPSGGARRTSLRPVAPAHCTQKSGEWATALRVGEVARLTFLAGRRHNPPARLRARIFGIAAVDMREVDHIVSSVGQG